MNARQKEHAAQFAAAFGLTERVGRHEQEKAIERQIDSFIVVEARHDKTFNEFAFVEEIALQIVLQIGCRILAGQVRTNCMPTNARR